MRLRVLLFATAREAAGRAHDVVDLADGATLADLAGALDRRYGDAFARVREGARLWVNGDEPPAGAATVLHDGDEVAVLPPVSGGSGGWSASGGADDFR
ncbi:MAG: hypothetical protein KatS3mg010_1970 [Acidimicrobiia bacterium]|nr:MAG: hypothetical protein KatS3mg010_1970 [Acidimicrobiia bacterium]